MESPQPAPDKDGPPAVQPAWQRKGTVYLLGVDGLTLDVIRPMVERGELPNLARLAREGCHGPLATIWPTNSSLLWTTISTGRRHEDHGIDGFQFYGILGRHLSRTTVRKYKGLTLRGVAFRLLLGVARLLHLRKRYYFDSRHVRAKTLWDIVSGAGGRAGVVNWWHSWPARPLNGFVVSDKLHYWRSASKGKTPEDTSLTYPDELLDALLPLMVAPDEVRTDELRRFIDLPEERLARAKAEGFTRRNPLQEVRFLVSADSTYSQVFDRCLEVFPDLQLAAVYFRGPDIVQHCAFDFMETSTASDATAEERHAFGGAVHEVYRFADGLIGKVLARLRPEDTVFVVSDHGYGYQGDYPGVGPYGHARGEPPGVIYACGPEFRQGAEIAGATVYDVAPTVLRVSGFPLSLELAGRCLEETLTDEFRLDFPLPEPVDTYGPPSADPRGGIMSAEVNKEITDHLRALGYLD